VGAAIGGGKNRRFVMIPLVHFQSHELQFAHDGPSGTRHCCRPHPAISCLGAFRTPAASARGQARHPGVRKPAQNTDIGRASSEPLNWPARPWSELRSSRQALQHTDECSRHAEHCVKRRQGARARSWRYRLSLIQPTFGHSLSPSRTKDFHDERPSLPNVCSPAASPD
jgi:hypothetical protein